MTLYDQQLTIYLENLVPDRPAELASMEAHARETSFPIIGPLAGHFCYMIAKIIGARRIFELGSGFGYSTAWFARAVQENGGGEVNHVVWDAALSEQARRHLNALGYGAIIRYQVGEAVAVLEKAMGPYDLIFNDIDKDGYPDSLPAIAGKLRSGGVLIVDNMFLGGRILEKNDGSQSWEGVRKFTDQITRDPTWNCSVIPIRDGLMLAIKA